MGTTVLYVHGTGVRKAAYEASASRIAKKLASVAPEVELQPCLWGDAFGAKLGLDGVSIPEYARPPGVSDSREENIALWDLLARDYLFELRELAASESDDFDPPVVQASKQAIRASFRQMPTNPAVISLLNDFDVSDHWQGAVNDVAGSDVLVNAIDAVRTALAPLRSAIARAIVAALQSRLADLNLPAIPRNARDDLVDECVELMGGAEAGGLMDWFTSRLVGLGLSWVTAKVRRKRDVIFGIAAPTAGDIVLYQARGQSIRDFIENQIRSCGEDVIVLAHSLGGIACVDLLIQKALPQVKGLVTVGSQAPFLYEINALTSLAFNQHLPEHFPKRWLNFFDCNDLLSYKAGPVFPGHANDVEIDSGQPFPQSHSAYWDADAFWQNIVPLLK